MTTRFIKILLVIIFQRHLYYYYYKIISVSFILSKRLIPNVKA